MKLKMHPVSRKKDLVMQKLSGELLIYDLEVNRAFCLNRTSALVWDLCDGERSVQTISKSLSATLKQNVTEDLVLLALDQLNKENLLENKRDTAKQFIGFSRREVIRRAALTSVVTLPLISSLVAPRAAAAQSIVSTCPPDTNDGFGGFAGDSCRCPLGVPSGTTCGIGGANNQGECRVGCICTSNGIEPFGGNFTEGICS